MDLERQKENFKNHVATFTDLDTIKILDFAEPGTNHYQIRFLFEEERCKLHISGDLGDLVASNYSNMCYDSFADFVHSPGYFKEKIRCSSRPLWEFDEELAKEELEDRAIRDEWFPEKDDEEFFEALEDLYDEVLTDYTAQGGISSYGYNILTNHDNDAFEWAYDLGKKSSGIVELYLMAFDLAQKQLKEREQENNQLPARR